MKYKLELNLPPEKINDHNFLYVKSGKKLNLQPDQISFLKILRRSLDARKKPVYRLSVEVFVNELPEEELKSINYNFSGKGKKVLVVGFGPAGMFGSLRLIEHGLKPIVLDRGKDVQSRRRDIRNLQQEHIVDPDSNYSFGEGGAGAYSDGKLYTRSNKRGNVNKILQILAQHGASNEILIDAHPHVGSNVLPKVVTNIRETIVRNGGEVHFNSRVTDLVIKNNKLVGVIVNNKSEYFADAVILATGHSARDIYYLLHKKNIRIEPKNFAMGVRIEHPQQLINEIQYHSKNYSNELPAASYNLSCSIDERGVYSFCMCPGGIIVPAATSPGEIVVNGMSLSRRDSPFANSGLVVAVHEKDWQQYDKEYPFCGLRLQEEIERLTFHMAGGTQAAPAQKVTDFVEGNFSQVLNETSYIPGLNSARLDKELPEFIIKRLKKALIIFDRKMRGFFTEEAQIVAAETRTSSPIRIPRGKITMMHQDVEGLCPAGEGAGYAGGIVSSAIDGENCADAVSIYLR